MQFEEIDAKFHFAAMATRVLNGLNLFQQFFEVTSEGSCLQSFNTFDTVDQAKIMANKFHLVAMASTVLKVFGLAILAIFEEDLIRNTSSEFYQI